MLCRILVSSMTGVEPLHVHILLATYALAAVAMVVIACRIDWTLGVFAITFIVGREALGMSAGFLLMVRVVLAVASIAEMALRWAVGTAIGGRQTALSQIIHNYASLAYGGQGASLWLDGWNYQRRERLWPTV